MNVKKLTYASIFLTFGMIIPYVTSHAFGIPGTILLPMHICVFIGAMLLGPRIGFLLGLLTPILSFLLTGMPNNIMVYIMTCELATYGLASGFLYKKLNIYLALISSMILGRISYAVSLFTLLNIFNLEQFSKIASVTTAVSTGIIGIIIQLVIIPIIVIKLKGILKYEQSN